MAIEGLPSIAVFQGSVPQATINAQPPQRANLTSGASTGGVGADLSTLLLKLLNGNPAQTVSSSNGVTPINDGEYARRPYVPVLDETGMIIGARLAGTNELAIRVDQDSGAVIDVKTDAVIAIVAFASEGDGLYDVLNPRTGQRMGGIDSTSFRCMGGPIF